MYMHTDGDVMFRVVAAALLSAVVVIALFKFYGIANAPGVERNVCYGNGTCDKGLVCASDTCVKMPMPDGGIVLEKP